MIPSHYERIGGENKIRALSRRFYEIMDELPDAHGIRNLHPDSLANSEEKLFKFLSGWMGGPQLFTEQYGPPMLRQRHLPFTIGNSEQDQWLACMRLALKDVVEDETLRNELDAAFTKVAQHMRNKS